MLLGYVVSLGYACDFERSGRQLHVSCPGWQLPPASDGRDGFTAKHGDETLDATIAPRVDVTKRTGKGT